jgi:predicted RNase H-like HicB family nuclease
MARRLTAVIQSEGNGFVALCPELDIASQGETIEAARDNLREALELFFECAPPAEVQQRSIIRQSGVPRSEFES